MPPDLHPDLHTKQCNVLIEAMHKCHAEKNLMKYLGGCDKEFYAAQECMNQEVTRTTIKARMSLNFGRISPLTAELAALERLKKTYKLVSTLAPSFLFGSSSFMQGNTGVASAGQSSVGSCEIASLCADGELNVEPVSYLGHKRNAQLAKAGERHRKQTEKRQAKKTAETQDNSIAKQES